MRNPWLVNLCRVRDGERLQPVFPTKKAAEEFCRQRLVPGITGTIFRRTDPIMMMRMLYFFEHDELHVWDVFRSTMLKRSGPAGLFIPCDPCHPRNRRNRKGR